MPSPPVYPPLGFSGGPAAFLPSLPCVRVRILHAHPSLLTVSLGLSVHLASHGFEHVSASPSKCPVPGFSAPGTSFAEDSSSTAGGGVWGAGQYGLGMVLERGVKPRSLTARFTVAFTLDETLELLLI